ncbi:cupin domain-containing protein [Brevibacillus reuszeri]|uniref:cupin domain-containing protein n=1 Tax=Brevibacillus reuszeri TaxID=54915 RepID=UPI0028A0AE81|nr:cupin domain-containing protein [Brevibacillus reuszeri]
MYRHTNHYYHWDHPMYGQWLRYNWDNYWNPYQINWNNRWGESTHIPLQDYGPKPLVIDIDQAAKQNNNYRTALWTGKYFQVTLMSINVGDDIGLEVHPETDQFIRIEEGQGLVQMGPRKDFLDVQEMAYAGYAVMVPAGTWHNVINTGNTPLKVYVIYAPPHHPFGTVHVTKADAMSEHT